MQEFLLIALVVFIFFGFLRRVIYFQAYSSFTKAAQDFQRQQQKQRKPEGSVTVDSPKGKRTLKDEGEYVDYEEIK
jgi:sortase (surface protein transpeptidase)